MIGVFVVAILLIVIYFGYRFVVSHFEAEDRLSDAKKKQIDLNIYEEAVEIEKSNAKRENKLER